jgi:group I intron endonuclease
MQDTNTYTAVIYIFTNKITGLSYIGQTINGMENRWKGHVSAANRHTDNYKFYNAIRKYGADVWTHGILVLLSKNQADTDSEEIRCIDEEDTFHNGYNSTKGGGGTSGRKHSKETRAKMSASKMGKKHTAKSKAKIAASHMGKKHNAESRAKMSASQLGKKLTAEHKANMSASQMGKKHTAETLEKMSASHMGKKLTAKTLEKLSGKNHHNYDHTVRTIEKPDATGDETKEFTGTRQGMLAEFPEMKPSGLNKMLSRKQETHKGWRLLD